MCGTTLALLSVAAIPTTPSACLVPSSTSTYTRTSTHSTHRFGTSLKDAPHTVLSTTNPTTGTTGTSGTTAPFTIVATAVVVKVLEASENERAVGCMGTYSRGARR